MKLLEAALAPLALTDLKEHYDNSRCLMLEGAEDKFVGLVTLEDIERRLNDGCNSSSFPQVIIDGDRAPNIDANCAWSAASLRKKQFLEDISVGHSFMMPNSSQISQGLSLLCNDIETYFEEDLVHADAHLYVSINDQGNSYQAHRDRPQHKILIQAHGAANWQLFEPKADIQDNIVAIPAAEQDESLELVSEFTLSQGDMLYMPPGVFHKVVSVEGPRISISIPFYAMASASKMDRTHIPFAKIFSHSD